MILAGSLKEFFFSQILTLECYTCRAGPRHMKSLAIL